MPPIEPAEIPRPFAPWEEAAWRDYLERVVAERLEERLEERRDETDPRPPDPRPARSARGG